MLIPQHVPCTASDMHSYSPDSWTHVGVMPSRDPVHPGLPNSRQLDSSNNLHNHCWVWILPVLISICSDCLTKLA